eukprot:6921189-Pyramimonas_sp.AAC.1
MLCVVQVPVLWSIGRLAWQGAQPRAAACSERSGPLRYRARKDAQRWSTLMEHDLRDFRIETWDWRLPVSTVRVSGVPK